MDETLDNMNLEDAGEDLNLNDVGDGEDFADLESMFGQDEEEAKQAENIVLTQNLDGFASCFPDWDLHPPVGI